MKKDKKIEQKIIPLKKKNSILSFSFGFAEESQYFVESLSMLLASGMDIIEALEAIKAEVKSTQLINIIDELVENINSGFSLWQSLEKTKLLPPHIISLIKIGEESGRLHQSLAVVVVQQSKSQSFKSKIRAAMMYPVFVMGVAMTVGIGIAWFILPKLSTVFNQLNLKLPLVTRLLMSFGSFLSKYGSLVVPIFILGISIIFYFLFFYRKTKFIGQAILFSIPGIKNLIREVELARFGYIMGTLLEAGLPVLEALNSLGESGTLRAYGKIYTLLKDGVEEGKSFEECFHSNPKIRKLIPTTIQSLIAVGERSGRLGKIFLNISESYENKTELIPPPKPVIVAVPVLPTTTIMMATSSPIIATSTITIVTPIIIPTTTPTSTPITSTLPISIPKIPTSGTLEILGFSSIYTLPNAKSEIVQQAAVGERFKYTDTKIGWYKIVLSPDQFGWVSAQYIQIVSFAP